MKWKMLCKWFMSSEVISHSCTSFQTFCAIWRKSVSLYERYAYIDASPHVLISISASKVISTFNRGELLTKVYHWKSWQNSINRQRETNTATRIPFQIWVVLVMIINKATACSHCAVNSRGDVRRQKSTMIVARHNTIKYRGCTCNICDLEGGKTCVY